ncbi:putative dihydroxyacetone synthase [Dendrothele bispora CBS 962.96]|uniref:transketolase n=1 Tax=Dendrothele bispora (strain CBS 962.96) TaxID=1314807 RepID=A0A4S8MT21_DENBC|nr:putative dihydroxyacetone synthase [Dendrothele bispora CBS 962.96]
MKHTELVVSTIRCLGADFVQQYRGGHAGTVLGAAPIAVSLWRDVMKYNPKDPLWFNRDRFVLSAGHACLFQYIMLHLTGYPIWTLDELKRYHSPNFKTSRAAGHPEIEQEGQGIANSVGLAIVGKQLAAQYSKSGFEGLINNTIWCFTGDGCLQEGVGQEAVSVAGHLGLDNLVLIYDQNKVTVDGTIDACFTEDVPLRFKAAKWNVIELDLNSPNLPSPQSQVSAVTEALLAAKAHKGAPTIVIATTTIGYGSRKANTGPAHGQPLGDEEVAYVKTKFGFNPDEKFVVPEEVYSHFAHVGPRGEALQSEWTALLLDYSKAFPGEYAELMRRISGKLPNGWRDLIPFKKDLPTVDQPTRKSSGIVVEKIAPLFPDIVAGSADLLESTFVSWKDMVEFQKPESSRGDYSGRQIRYGIREFAMAAIANGMAAYFPVHPGREGGGILPIYSTFFMFTSYALNAIRMAALQKLRTISVATHDSIGIGEDGPTHQPIALAAFFRALPNVRLWRPADAEETMAAWINAIGEDEGPSVLCLSRQPLPLLEGSDRQGAWRGAYVVHPEPSNAPPKLVLVATGSEVSLATKVAERLSSSSVIPDLPVRVVSAPCLSIFDRQDLEYRRSTIPSDRALVVSIEAWTSFGWARYAHAAASMSTFGHSGPQAALFEYFGFGVDHLTKVIGDWVEKWSVVEGGKRQLRIPGIGDFEELLDGPLH